MAIIFNLVLPSASANSHGGLIVQGIDSKLEGVILLGYCAESSETSSY